MAGVGAGVPYETLRALRFTGAFAKLDRADAHLAELRCELTRHLQRADLVVGRLGYKSGQPGKGGEISGRYRVQGLPHRIPVIAGDVIHNLRSALDHVVWQLVIANGGTPTFRTDLPIHRTEPIDRRTRRPRPVEIVGRVGDTAWRIIVAEQPFSHPPWEPMTNMPLARLQHISNTDKHRTLVRGGHGLQNLLMTAGPVREDGEPWMGRIVLGEVEGYRRHVRLEPMPGSEGQVDGSATYEVEIEYAPGDDPNQPHRMDDLEPTLTELARYVRTLVGRLVAAMWPDHLATRP